MQQNTAGRARTLKVTTLGMLAAVAIVLVAVIHLPILPAAPFLEYDPADIPILIGTFLYGPWTGLALTVVVSLLQGITVSAASGLDRNRDAHSCDGWHFAGSAGSIYRVCHTAGGAALALVAGSIAMTIIMVGCNLVFTPIFMGTGIKEVIALLGSGHHSVQPAEGRNQQCRDVYCVQTPQQISEKGLTFFRNVVK